MRIKREKEDEEKEEKEKEEEDALLHASPTTRLRHIRASGPRNALRWPQLVLSGRSRSGTPQPFRLGGGPPHVHADARRLHSKLQETRCMAQSANAV
eukprot:8995452-Pyramimonas_sp.AAC.1